MPGERPVLDAEEQEAMDHLLAYMAIVNDRWCLRANSSEMASAIHVLQGFITQHMLHRLAPEAWGSWWEDPPACTCGAAEGRYHTAYSEGNRGGHSVACPRREYADRWEPVLP